MPTASRQTRDLLLLAESLAAHEEISLQALSGRAMGKGGFFNRLKFGTDCHTATTERVLEWFVAVWPAELTWPDQVSPGPLAAPGATHAPGPRSVLPEPDDAFLAGLSHAPIWKNGRHPPWWDDMDVRAFLTRSHRQMSTLKAARIGERCLTKSSIHAYWQRSDKFLAQKGSNDIPRPKPIKKEVA